MSSRAFCFTDYVCDINFWKDISGKEKPRVIYVIVGRETCPTTNRQHFQGYIYYENARKLSAVIKQFKPRHVEIAVKEAHVNRTYCSKEMIEFEYGVIPRQGARIDLDDVRDEIAARQ